MDLIKNDVEAAKRMANSKGNNPGVYTKHASVFLFGTESQEGVNDVISYKDKDVFTVSSSGDQYVGAVYYGAKKVDLYDVNRLTYYLTILKIASIVVLDYEEFMSFLVPVHSKDIQKSFWDLKTLKKVIKIMPSDAAYFWDNIMYECKKVNFDCDFITPRHKHAQKDNVVAGMPFYAKPEEYYKLQSLLRKREFPKFYESDILHLGKVMCDEYDVIYLSNIIECLVCLELMDYPYSPSCDTENVVEEKYIFKIAKEVIPHLREDGTILFDYRPNNSKYCATDLLFQNDYFEINEIKSKFPASWEYNRGDETDLVLTYKPKKTGNILDLLKK